MLFPSKPLTPLPFQLELLAQVAWLEPNAAFKLEHRLERQLAAAIQSAFFKTVSSQFPAMIVLRGSHAVSTLSFRLGACLKNNKIEKEGKRKRESGKYIRNVIEIDDKRLPCQKFCEKLLNMSIAAVFLIRH